MHVIRRGDVRLTRWDVGETIIRGPIYIRKDMLSLVMVMLGVTYTTALVVYSNYLLGELVLSMVPPRVNSTMAQRRIPFTVLVMAVFCSIDQNYPAMGSLQLISSQTCCQTFRLCIHEPHPQIVLNV